jgi:DNA-binding transcriptional ArsR family regulator
MNNKKITLLLKNLSVESRLELFNKLNTCECDGETKACMTDLSKGLNMSLPNVQRNIRELENSGLVEVDKISRTCYCKVTKLGKKVFYLLNELDDE